MNIEELINNIKKNPKTYISENISLNNIFMYVNGFRYGKLHTYGNIDIEECFTHKFCDYCVNWINKDKNLNISSSTRGYVFYIETYYKDDETINIFFKICNDFFKDFHNNNLEYNYNKPKVSRLTIKALIEYMQKRPQMFVGSNVCFSNIMLFIKGFIDSKKSFIYTFLKARFKKFVVNWINKNKNFKVKYIDNVDYEYYIFNFFEPDKQVDIFFNICNDFFKNFDDLNENLNIDGKIYILQKRPQMLIGENVCFKKVILYISASMYQPINKLDIAFKQNINLYTKKWIEKNKNITIKDLKGYIYYIDNFFEEDEKVNIFINICNNFIDDFYMNEIENICYNELKEKFLIFEDIIKILQQNLQKFIGDNCCLEDITLFFYGFWSSRDNINYPEPTIIYFRNEFYNYCLNWINKDKKNLNLTSSARGYTFYIKTYYKKDETINVFFKICNDFFKDFHNKNKK